MENWREIWIRCLLVLILFALSSLGNARAWDSTPLGFGMVPRQPTEIERYWVIRGQLDDGTPVQPLDPEPLQPLDPPLIPALERVLELPIGREQQRPVGGVLSTDIAQSLQQASTIQTTNVRRRSPIAQEPYVRGYHTGQIYGVADGVFWTAARADLDSVLNKVDASLVEQIEVTPGPYGLRHGPGFAYIDVVMAPTPRYAQGFQVQNRMTWNFHFNRGQIYGTDTISGGAERYGFSFTYGHRVGSDYRAGDGLRIPASYNVGNLLGQIGFDIEEDSRLEFRYQYLNERDTDYAAQFFDINSLVTNAFSLNHVKGAADDWARLESSVWYHETDFAGDTTRDGKREDFPVLERVTRALKHQNPNYDSFFGSTDGRMMSTGARGAIILEPVDSLKFRLGTDFRLIDQEIREDFVLGTLQGEDEAFTTNLPRARLVDPGIYAETALNWTPFWETRWGGRFDWAYTTAQEPVPPASSSSLEGDLYRGEPLFSTYLTNTMEIDPHWTTHLGVGYGEVVPDLFQRYANGLFLGIIQSGFSRVIGSPDLQKERLLQLDVEARADYERFRGRAAFFHGWLFDYATYSANIISDPTDARLLKAMSTERASLTGFEFYAECDLFTWLTPFGSARYAHGRDRVINQPLPQVAPFESTVGLRVDRLEAPRPWGIEGGVRMVARQDRAARVRITGQDTGLIDVESPTPGFSTTYLRAHYSPRQNLNFVGGVENLFDRSYIEHLDLRLPADDQFRATRVLSPGITPFIGVEWTL